MEGFIKIHRGLMKWEWYDDSKTLHVFLTILLNANHKDGRWQGHEVKRGQWITGRKALSKMTNISERSIRTILQRLVETGELTIQTTNRFSIITVVKWDSYQFQDNVNDQPDANKRPATDQLPTTNKNEEKVKNEKKEHTGEGALSEIIDLLKPEFPNVTPAQIGAVKTWIKKGKTLTDIQDALIKTAGSQRSATRWGWIVDEMNKVDKPEKEEKPLSDFQKKARGLT